MQTVLFFLLSGLVLPGLLLIGGVSGRPHEFEFVDGQGHVGCVTCHHPHKPTGKSARWQAVEKIERLAVYTPQKSTPGESTLMCLSCHDGAIAAEVPVGMDKGIVSRLGQSRSFAGDRDGFFFRSHPVGVVYEDRADKLVPKSTIESAKGDGKVRLIDGRVECISCHDPHGISGQEHLLIKSNRRSELCRTCHNQ